jgi:hypothetical protein
LSGGIIRTVFRLKCFEDGEPQDLTVPCESQFPRDRRIQNHSCVELFKLVEKVKNIIELYDNPLINARKIELEESIRSVEESIKKWGTSPYLYPCGHSVAQEKLKLPLSQQNSFMCFEDSCKEIFTTEKPFKNRLLIKSIENINKAVKDIREYYSLQISSTSRFSFVENDMGSNRVQSIFDSLGSFTLSEKLPRPCDLAPVSTQSNPSDPLADSKGKGKENFESINQTLSFQESVGSMELQREYLEKFKESIEADPFIDAITFEPFSQENKAMLTMCGHTLSETALIRLKQTQIGSLKCPDCRASVNVLGVNEQVMNLLDLANDFYKTWELSLLDRHKKKEMNLVFRQLKDTVERCDKESSPLGNFQFRRQVEEMSIFIDSISKINILEATLEDKIVSEASISNIKGVEHLENRKAMISDLQDQLKTTLAVMYVCPVTQELLTSPVTSSSCLHTYEESSAYTLNCSDGCVICQVPFLDDLTPFFVDHELIELKGRVQNLIDSKVDSIEMIDSFEENLKALKSKLTELFRSKVYPKSLLREDLTQEIYQIVSGA